MITFYNNLKLISNTGTMHQYLFKVYCAFLGGMNSRPRTTRQSILYSNNYILEPGQYCLSPAMEWLEEINNNKLRKDRAKRIKQLRKSLSEK